jgi:hypothetical protein
MKNKLIQTLVSLSLLSSVSCGKAVQKVANDITKKTGEQLACGGAQALGAIPASLAADYDIKIYHKTVEKVMADIRPIKDLEAKDFWTTLSEESRDALNFELNTILRAKSTKNAQAVYQGTAYFFTNVKDAFMKNTDYKLRDANGFLFSFVVRAQKTNQTVLINYKCGSHEKTDLSAIKIGPEVLLESETKEIYECQTLTKSVRLVEVRDTLFVNLGKTLYRFPLKELKKKDNKRRLELALESREVNFKINIKKNKDLSISNSAGKRSGIELVAPDYSIDEEGVCSSLMHSFET